MTANVLTRKDCEDQLPEGTDPVIVAMHVAATAEERAASRCAAAREAALAVVPDDLLATLLAVELGGTGGRMGFGIHGGESTARMSWAAGLGKGRRQASDGECWTRAIKEALDDTLADARGKPITPVTPDSVVRLASLCSQSDIEWPLAYALRQAYALRTSPEDSAPWAEAARRIAARCEANSDAGRLADRWRLATLPWLYEATINLTYRVDDDDDAAALITEDGAEMIVEEIIEEFSGALFTFPSYWTDQKFRLDDDTDTVLSITRSHGHFRIHLRTRRAGHPTVVSAIRTAWVMRHSGDSAYEAAVIAAHDTMAGIHRGMLPAVRAKWDAEFGNGNWRSDVKVGIEYDGHALSPVRWICRCGAHGDWIHASGRPESAAQDEARMAGASHDCGNPGQPDPDQ